MKETQVNERRPLDGIEDLPAIHVQIIVLLILWLQY